jgi:hypothetical protein
LRLAKEVGKRVVQETGYYDSEVESSILKILAEQYGIRVKEQQLPIREQIRQKTYGIRDKGLVAEIISRVWRGGRERDGD